MSNEILTIGDLKNAINKAKRVFVRPVFFGTESQIQITKIEARYFISGYGDNLTAADLHHRACLGDTLATIHDDSPDDLYIG